MPIYLPEAGIAYPNDNTLEILSQITSDDGVSYIEVYEKHGPFEDDRDKQDKWILVWHNHDTHSEYHYDERDLVDTMSVLAQALSVIQNRK